MKNIHKKFRDKHVLRGIDLNVNDGDVVVIIGPSGSGKTTLLRCINLLEQADSGTLTIGDKTVDLKTVKKQDVIEMRKRTAMVFQNYNLFRNKNVLENITEGLTTVRKMPQGEAKDIAYALLEKVGMKDRAADYPSKLSGGQQQRVGIVRALALNPQVILLDEPTSALDPELVGDILALISKIAKEGITMIVVTHEMSFAASVANHLVFIDDGVIVEEGPPNELFLHPKEERTQQFIERINPSWFYNI